MPKLMPVNYIKTNTLTNCVNGCFSLFFYKIFILFVFTNSVNTSHLFLQFKVEQHWFKK